MLRTALLALSLTLTVGPAGAAMYKWKDAGGNTQYGEFPPPGAEAERISPSGTSHKVAPQDTRSPQQRVEKMEAQESKKNEEAAAAQAEAHLQELRRENCNIARNNLAVLKEGGHHRVRLPDGTVTYLTDEQKQQRIEEANQQVKDNCD
jgi:hypothetical protein